MLHPNNKQQTRLFEFAGAARYAYNWSLERQEANHKKGNKFLSDRELRSQFTQFKQQEENQWLYSISNDVTKQAIKDATDAYISFFKGIAKHPVFKSRRKSKPSFYVDTDKIVITSTHVKLEKITNSKRKNRQRLNYIRLAEKDRIPKDAKYVNPRVTFDGLHWWLSIGVLLEDIKQEKTVRNGQGIGIDLGVKISYFRL